MRLGLGIRLDDPSQGQWPPRSPLLLGFLLSLALLAVPAVSGATTDFARDILPILEARCQACHPANGGQANLALVSRESILAGGKSGPAINPGNPDGSLLMSKVSGSKPLMPPAGDPLSAEQVDILRAWIAEGAPGDSDQTSSDQTWWSFRALVQPPVPDAGDDRAVNEIDRFVAAKLAEHGLSPSPAADRATLIRRLTYGLHGLPPEPGAIKAFLDDSRPDAYARLVDRLLASPRYGERWGRHWLDVAHYGESHGYDKDKARRNSWPYRDYVIRSFNNDKPYRRFIREQLAGDILWPSDSEGLIATGFIAAGPWDYVGHAELREGTKDKRLARLLDRDDMVAATMSTFNSLTVHCARCHDHKFDPIRQADYYALQAVFAGVDRAEQPYFDDPALHAQARKLWFEIGAVEQDLRAYGSKIEEAKSDEIEEIDQRKYVLGEESADLLPKVGEVDTPETIARRKEISKELKRLDEERQQLALALLDPADRERYESLSARLKELQAAFDRLPEPRYVYSAARHFKTHGRFTPAWTARPVHVLAKGSIDSPGAPASPGAVGAVPGLAARFPVEPQAGEGAARVALAEWIADPSNPLTWRSIVNRVWHYHFGRGIVDSPNDFGRMGSEPTHPDLLEWLAADFRDSGGSLKNLHRKILLSATYRQNSAPDPQRAKIDASNRFLWRMNRTRLDAEAVRDAVLAVSGQLDLTMGGPSAEHFYFKDDHSPIYDYARFDVTSPAARRRSVYRFLVRSVQDPFMESLDCADPSLLVPKRSSTLTAIQALALLNDPLMVEQSRRFAVRLQEAAETVEGQVDSATWLALGRPAETVEQQALARHAEQHGIENAARLLLNSNEFIFVD